MQEKVWSRLKAGALFTGMALDGVNKMGQEGMLENPFPLGHGTFLENHIGNFLPSVATTLVVRYTIRTFEWEFNKQLDPKLRDTLTFLVVAGANVFTETVLTHPNPEMMGDIGVGLIAALMYLAWSPSRRQNIQVAVQS